MFTLREEVERLGMHRDGHEAVVFVDMSYRTHWRLPAFGFSLTEGHPCDSEPLLFLGDAVMVDDLSMPHCRRLCSRIGDKVSRAGCFAVADRILVRHMAYLNIWQDYPDAQRLTVPVSFPVFTDDDYVTRIKVVLDDERKSVSVFAYKPYVFPGMSLVKSIRYSNNVNLYDPAEYCSTRRIVFDCLPPGSRRSVWQSGTVCMDPGVLSDLGAGPYVSLFAENPSSCRLDG